jgi:hypothetical protein
MTKCNTLDYAVTVAAQLARTYGRSYYVTEHVRATEQPWRVVTHRTYIRNCHLAPAQVVVRPSGLVIAGDR